MADLPIREAMMAPRRDIPGAGLAKEPPDREKLKKACEDFESLFLLQILKSMRQMLPGRSFLGEGPGKEIYQSLLDEQLSRSLARSGGLGLGAMLYRQMARRTAPAGKT